MNHGLDASFISHHYVVLITVRNPHKPPLMKSPSRLLIPPALLLLKARPLDRTVPFLYRYRAMATATKIHLTLSEAGVFHTPGITAQSAAKASEVLQQNHEENNVFYNQEGYHVG